MDEETCGLSVLKSVDYSAPERELLRDLRIVCLTDDIDCCNATAFIQDMILLTSKSTEPITIIIASNGGDVDAGLTCVRAIKEAQSKNIKVIGKVYGHCMSMAFCVLQCCDERIMGVGDILMAHGITSLRHGDSRSFDAETKLLKFYQRYFSNIVANRCINKKLNGTEYWLKILEDQVPQYFTSKDSLDLGLIDKVEGVV
jgi:ATP-dependent protease ClpP protease subunit